MVDATLDQAAGLRQLLAPRRRPIVCVLAADQDRSVGGLARGLAEEIVSRGRTVRLIDCVCAGDLNASADRGVTPNPDRSAQALRVVPAQHIGLTFGATDDGDAAVLSRALAALRGPAECAVVYAPAGSVSFAVAADEVVLVAHCEAAAILDCYRLLKRMHQAREREKAHVIVAGAGSTVLATRIFGNLSDAAGRFLGLPLEYLGTLPQSGRPSAALQAGAEAILRSI